MSEDRYRVLFVATHPVQYAAPIFRQMSVHRQLDIQVAYCSLQGAEGGTDPEFGVEVKWDIPLLEGYPWVLVSNKSPRPGLARFFGLVNPGLWSLIRSGDFDAVVVHTGYVYLSFWIALAATKFYRVALLFGTDAHSLASRDGKKWKSALKRLVWPQLFALADVVIVPSSRSFAMMRDLGIPDGRLALTADVVDNDWWTKQAQGVDRRAVRVGWGIPEDAPVVLFCAKLQPWKGPLDLLRSFAKANVPDAHLVYAGDGPLRKEAETLASSLGIRARVHFIGFANQSQLPAVYSASDLLVLPSHHEPFGVVVNEAMLCGCGAVVSDRAGAAYDLIQAGRTGYVFRCGDVDALAEILSRVLRDRRKLAEMGESARIRMETWSPRENIEALLDAVRASSIKKRRSSSESVDLQPRLRA
jgi:glycosyltransferase involved in cell wall biosynthesis